VDKVALTPDLSMAGETKCGESATVSTVPVGEEGERKAQFEESGVPRPRAKRKEGAFTERKANTLGIDGSDRDEGEEGCIPHLEVSTVPKKTAILRFSVRFKRQKV